MIDILIKSFNRPYYLDRCITSIYQNVEGNFAITVLDDGTPEKYIFKLKEKFPEVLWEMSENAQKKRKSIEENLNNGTEINGFEIPTKLWKAAVSNTEKYVLVTEDDVWFTQHIHLSHIAEEMEYLQIPLVKLGWLGMRNDENFCKTGRLSEILTEYTPKNLFTANKTVMGWFFYNKFKFFTILYKLGLVDNKTREKYWSINSILMGLYHKEYWLAIWKDATGKVDEKQQLRNAAAWYHENKKARFARTSQEVMKTTFQSSATGSYHEYDGVFDINRFNFILNEAWYHDNLDAMQNYPNDFSEEYIMRFLDQEKHPRAQCNNWMTWAERFKNQYKNLGAITH